MKVTSSPVKFQPVSIHIEFQSQRELDAFGALFNCCRLTYAANLLGFPDESFGEPIRNSIGEIGGDVSTGDISPVQWAQNID
jgi:hypothetical protein